MIDAHSCLGRQLIDSNKENSTLQQRVRTTRFIHTQAQESRWLNRSVSRLPPSKHTGTAIPFLARTVDGTLWNDLPFFTSDMTALWAKNRATMSGTHRLNFATFLAKLASARVAKDQLCQIALLIFRDLFEVGRDLRTGEQSDEEDLHRGIRHLEVFHLLPAAVAWLKEAGHNIILLSDVYWNDCSSDTGKGGRGFLESELGQRSPVGFSPWRYMFWLKRLVQIQEEAEEADDKPLGELAKEGCEYMINMIRDRNSKVLRAYKNGGDALHQDKHLLCLKSLAYPEDLVAQTRRSGF
ncbi:unnamed protein product [Penicillium olsonii]|nr:unnamed protein product [Penicillium olsonii]